LVEMRSLILGTMADHHLLDVQIAVKVSCFVEIEVHCHAALELSFVALMARSADSVAAFDAAIDSSVALTRSYWPEGKGRVNSWNAMNF
jgi:pyruvate/oxaloacetate carboxyltransferase